ncbi:hypothetical protein DFJ73DRAFT_838237 [Zopfochytrium polystomum]|nr:hypothetical protein DFJ73DRAFT_838237 [Zopfochytrium polystomum]
MFKAYDRLLNRFPTLTQAGTCGLLFIAGDVMAQQLVERRGLRRHDAVRTAQLAAYGGLVAGPAIGLWYPFLQRAVTLKSPFQALLARVAADQLIFAPTFIACFFSFNALVAGEGVAGIKNRLSQGYVPALLNNWIVWPPVQLANFHLVPVLYRSLVVNTTATGWNTYLSYMNASIKSKTAAEPLKEI